MKRYVIGILFCTIFYALAKTCVCGKTFFPTNPPYQPGTPEYHTWFDSRNWLQYDNRFNFECTIFGGASRNGGEIGTYFSPTLKNTLIVAQDGSTFDSSRDINAKHLNINYTGTNVNPFVSKIDLCPRYTEVGAGLHARLKLFSIHDRYLWIDASTPLMHVRTNMNLCESIINAGEPEVATGAVANVIQAFSQPSWCFGKTCGSQSKNGFADVNVLLGYELLRSDDKNIDGYIGGIIPTGNKPEGVFIFEPLIGNNHHWGILLGMLGTFCIFEHENLSLALLINMNGQYLFSNKQTRSFDLINKPWSRYMNVYLNQDNARSDVITPGINIFTQCMEVHPHYKINGSFAFSFSANSWGIQVGDYFHAQQEEEVCLANGFPNQVALVGAAENGTTSQARTITYNYRGTPSTPTQDADINQGTYVSLSGCDIDLNSAATPGFISHSLFGTFAYFFPDHQHIDYFALGGSYQFATVNSVLHKWLVWGKLCFSF